MARDLFSRCNAPDKKNIHTPCIFTYTIILFITGFITLHALSTPIHAFTITGDFREPDSTGPTEQGLNYAYYEGAWTSLPDFSALPVIETDSCTFFDLTQVPHRDADFGIVYTGFIDIILDGVYTFYTNSDDGSMLLIGDSILVNNDSVHTAAVEKSGAIGLAAGKHSITVRYFCAAAPQSLTVSYECTDLGINKQEIPPEALYRPYSGVIPTLTIILPNGGETYQLGDTITVDWTYTNALNHQVMISLSLDNGRTFQLMNPEAYIMTSESGQYKYAIPDDTTLVTSEARVMVSDYITGGPFDKSDEKFSIIKNTAIQWFSSQSKPGSVLTVVGNVLHYPVSNIKEMQSIKLSLFNIKGEKLPLTKQISSTTITWNLPAHAAGYYVAVLKVNGVREVQRGVITSFQAFK